MESVIEMMHMFAGNEGQMRLIFICLPLFMLGLRAAGAQLVGHVCIQGRRDKRLVRDNHFCLGS